MYHHQMYKSCVCK